jgi:hypothetical protein
MWVMEMQKNDGSVRFPVLRKGKSVSGIKTPNYDEFKIGNNTICYYGSLDEFDIIVPKNLDLMHQSIQIITKPSLSRLSKFSRFFGMGKKQIAIPFNNENEFITIQPSEPIQQIDLETSEFVTEKRKIKVQGKDINAEIVMDNSTAPPILYLTYNKSANGMLAFVCKNLNLGQYS